jgi:hypothetical protein
MTAQRPSLILGTAGHIDHAASRVAARSEAPGAERSRTG